MNPYGLIALGLAVAIVLGHFWRKRIRRPAICLDCREAIGCARPRLHCSACECCIHFSDGIAQWERDFLQQQSDREYYGSAA